MKKEIVRATVGYAFVQGVFWMSYSAILSYSSVFLFAKGFTSTEVGILIGVAGTVSGILQPLVAGAANRFRHFDIKNIVLSITLLLLFLAGMLFFTKQQRIPVFLLYSGLVIFLQVLTPLVNSLGMECINSGIALNFGLARGMGSLSFAIFSYVLGFMISIWGVVAIPCSIFGIFFFFFIAVFRFRYVNIAIEKRKRTSNQKSTESILKAEEVTQKYEKSQDKTFFQTYDKFGFYLAGCILLFTSHNMINNFIYQIIGQIGGGSKEMGIVMALAAVCELPTMMLFVKMNKKIKCSVWIKISGVFFMLKAVGTMLVPNVIGMYLIQILQMFGFALFIVASVYYVNERMQDGDRMKGQAYTTMTATLGSVAGSFAGGALIDYAGVDMMLGVSSLTAFLGMLIIFTATKLPEPVNHS